MLTTPTREYQVENEINTCTLFIGVYTAGCQTLELSLGAGKTVILTTCHAGLHMTKTSYTLTTGQSGNRWGHQTDPCLLFLTPVNIHSPRFLRKPSHKTG